jgi:molybdenum-dependent DNA-binding transcriptional regulator ModE
VARQLVRAGIIREVTLTQARAWRLSYPSAPEALRALERATGRPMVAWDMGRDPDWAATEDPPHTLA